MSLSALDFIGGVTHSAPLLELMILCGLQSRQCSLGENREVYKLLNTVVPQGEKEGGRLQSGL